MVSYTQILIACDMIHDIVNRHVFINSIVTTIQINVVLAARGENIFLLNF